MRPRCHASTLKKGRVLHVSVAELVQRLIDRMRTEPTARALPARPPADLLAVDDLHVLRNRQATQSEVAAAFELVVVSGRRVACAAGCTPAEIPCLARLFRERPQSRLVELRPARDAGMQRVVGSLAASEGLDLTPSALKAIAGACHGTSVEEMETASAAQVAAVLKVRSSASES